MKTIVIIGGGITGLSAMYYLQKEKREKQLNVNLILVDGQETLGGKIRTLEKGDFLMETGADSIVARNKNVLPFVEELKLENELVYNTTGTSYIHTEEKLLEIPKDSIFGIPMTFESLNESQLISMKGKLAVLRDLFRQKHTFTKESSVGEVLEYFFGKELVEKQIAPVLSGVYSGSLNALTMASTLPYLLDYKDKYGSIIRGLGKHKDEFQSAANKKFISFKNGLSTIINRLEEVLTDVTIIKGVNATKVEKKQEGKYLIRLSDQKELVCDSVVLSTPHDVSQKILNNPVLDGAFQMLHNASSITLYLAYDIPDHRLPKDGTGFIVGKDSVLTCDACTWTSRKWQHTSKKKQLLIRVFYKGINPEYPKLNALSEEELVAVAIKDIEVALGITENPVSYEVTKWNNAMPVYSLQHKEAVDKLEMLLSIHYPTIYLAGCSYYGVGIAACIANGEATAKRVVSTIHN